jgi:hypothetical protein
VSKNNIALSVFFIALFVELGLQTFWLEKTNVYVAPCLYLLAGIAICMATYELGKNNAAATVPTTFSRKNEVIWLIFAALSVFTAIFLTRNFAKYPIDPNLSDIVPSIQAYVQRLFRGETIYAPIQFPSWLVQPTYLPFMWLPYSFSEALQVDYRWSAYSIFLVVIAIFIWRMLREAVPFWEALVKIFVPFVLMWVFIDNKPHIFGMSVELLVTSYYLLVALGFGSKKAWWVALPLVSCLLSRYAIVFWLPLYIVIFYVENGWKRAAQVAVWSLGLLLITYIIPFLSKDWTMFGRGLGYYDSNTILHWQPATWQNPNEKPFYLKQGLGFAIYVYDFFSGTIPEKVALMKKIYITMSILSVIVLGGFYFWKRKTIDSRLFLLISMKFYLTFFYAFIFLPLNYLFQLPLFYSIALLFGVRFGRNHTS